MYSIGNNKGQQFLGHQTVDKNIALDDRAFNQRTIGTSSESNKRIVLNPNLTEILPFDILNIFFLTL